MDNTDRGNKPDHADGDPRPAAVTFVTTEHFTLAGARSSTISESTGRASVFLGAVSGGLIALGLVATAAKTGAAFYMFGLILLPTLAFVGLATFHRVLQSGIEDLAYARRIAQLRDYYFDHAPELAGYLLNPAERLPTPGLGIGLWQQFVTVAGMVAVITAVLAGLGRRSARGRSFWPLAGRGACRRRGRRRCGTDRADAISEFGLDPGQHDMVVPRCTSRTELKPAWTERAICRAPPTRPEDRVNGQIGRAATSGLLASVSGMVAGLGVCGLVTGYGYLWQSGVGSKGVRADTQPRALDGALT